jgi:hypothetical protein
MRRNHGPIEQILAGPHVALGVNHRVNPYGRSFHAQSQIYSHYRLVFFYNGVGGRSFFWSGFRPSAALALVCASCGHGGSERRSCVPSAWLTGHVARFSLVLQWDS